MASVSEEFGSSPEDVRAARRFATRVMDDWGVEADRIALVVSELAANAVLHAHSPFTVSLARRDGCVVIEVADSAHQMPPVTPAQVDGDAATSPAAATSGRGLLIVQRLSDGWGVRQSADGGKVVWAEVPAGA